nr:amidotransferase [uncultured Carboxylicivirga sp.]
MKTIRIHYLQHVPFEGLGYIETWANERNYPLTSTLLYEEAKFPAIDDFDMLVVMGGPMGIYDEDVYPWLKAEKAFIHSAIKADKIVLGICLGSQFIADALGAKVYANKQKEIGWFPIAQTDAAKGEELIKDLPDSLNVMHWHGDTFDLPEGAVHLMQSEACVNQAYLYNNKVLGLQFHLETTPESLQNLINNCREELVPEEFIQSEAAILKSLSECNTTNQYLSSILANLVKL